MFIRMKASGIPPYYHKSCNIKYSYDKYPHDKRYYKYHSQICYCRQQYFKRAFIYLAFFLDTDTIFFNKKDDIFSIDKETFLRTSIVKYHH